MKTIPCFIGFALASLFLLVALTQVATPPPPDGHWNGAITLPNIKLQIPVDPAPCGDAGTWSGTIDIPRKGSADSNSPEFQAKAPA